MQLDVPCNLSLNISKRTGVAGSKFAEFYVKTLEYGHRIGRNYILTVLEHSSIMIVINFVTV